MELSEWDLMMVAAYRMAVQCCLPAYLPVRPSANRFPHEHASKLQRHFPSHALIKERMPLRIHCHDVRPAAVDSTAFLPDLSRRRQPGGRVTVVALSRLVYRKGVDLLNVVIPAVCRRQPHVDFIIGADTAGRIYDDFYQSGYGV